MRTRADNPHGLPPRMYERTNRKGVTWWVKAPDRTTFIIRTIQASATPEQVALARQAAVEAFKLNKKWSAPTGKPDPANWVESYGRVDAAASRMVGGAPVWARRLYRSSKNRAAQRGVVWLLSPREFHAVAERCAGLCEVSGVPLMLTNAGLKGPYGPSLDRIDSRGHYAPGNVRIVCVAVNFALNSWGLEAFLPIARALAKKHESADSDSKL